MGYLLGEMGYLQYLYIVINKRKQMIMNTLMLIKHFETRTVIAKYFKSEDEAIRVWRNILFSEGWEIVYLKERKPSGHRYQLTCIKQDKQDKLHSRYIICFSKKEALYLKNKIERINQHYIIQIKKLY